MITYIVAVIAVGNQGLIPPGVEFAVAGAAGLIAIVGFIDDLVSLPPSLRLSIHFIAASIGLYWLGGVPVIPGFSEQAELRCIINILALLGVVWMLNLYNFMDGINGIASVGVICSALPMAFLYTLQNQLGEPVPLILLSGCVAGFALLNFPRAYLFLGDVGSGFLGVLLGLFIIQAANLDFQYVWAWLILLGVYICDATLTLLRRVISGHAPHHPHRTHAYQKAAAWFGSHTPVTLLVAAIMLLWLFPLATAVVVWHANGPLLTVLAYAPLIALGLRFRSGVGY